MARKAVSSNVYRLVGTYERLRKRLLSGPSDGRLDRSLSYWVLPTDRRLPIAFLDRQLRDLLDESFDELLRTPGVGTKKIEGFFELLRRAAKAEPADPPFGMDVAGGKEAGDTAPTGFDPTQVSESLWSTWCDTVRQHEFTDHQLGRLAPTLQSLPTVIWHKPLSEYADRSLAQPAAYERTAKSECTPSSRFFVPCMKPYRLPCRARTWKSIYYRDLSHRFRDGWQRPC